MPFYTLLFYTIPNKFASKIHQKVTNSDSSDNSLEKEVDKKMDISLGIDLEIPTIIFPLFDDNPQIVPGRKDFDKSFPLNVILLIIFPLKLTE